MKQESSAINPFNGMFGQQGWICPKCGRVFSPFTSMCLYCNKGTSTSTSSNIEKFTDETHKLSFENMGEACRGYLKKRVILMINVTAILMRLGKSETINNIKLKKVSHGKVFRSIKT